MNLAPDSQAIPESAHSVDTRERPLSGLQELRRHWPLLLATVLGISVGIAAIPGNALSVFLRAMQHDLGWSRAQISLGGTIVLLVVAGVSPLLGWVADRVRTIWITGAGLVGLSVALLLFSRLNANVGVYYAGCVLLGIAGAGSATVPYARAVSTAFVRIRGFALGLSTVGTGVAAFVLPEVLAPYAARVGWRAGFVALGIAVAIGMLIVAALLSRSPVATRPPGAVRLPEVADSRVGSTLREALRGRTFWTLAACFFLLLFAMAGLQLHLLSYLQDSGVGLASAAKIASLAGVGVIIFRPLGGWLFDRFYAPRTASVILVVATACVLAVAVFGASAAPLAALAIGLATGAEFDLIGYLAARYFGQRSYGRIYGLFYLLATVGAALSGVFYGAVQDGSGSYLPALFTTAGLLMVSAVLLLTLRRYPTTWS
ncbi:MFS transporter [Amycolatopsis rhizosphaerae]|uniref:MFS transporter n=1 Tax=Amycolatopsis rhizosphaerae TaxID=2053003 RepID=A0A558D6S7_9PSEU|nr:MFS transporter [Amycolatopsis rhizosphaerae]TVT56707.1 MFS transporter [Amycolatopsis rhizosphaerae]